MDLLNFLELVHLFDQSAVCLLTRSLFKGLKDELFAVLAEGQLSDGRLLLLLDLDAACLVHDADMADLASRRVDV